ncbi:MAG: efflux RND transporter periplasmic adaptor subunit [Oceanidesulfovibrio sp.]
MSCALLIVAALCVPSFAQNQTEATQQPESAPAQNASQQAPSPSAINGTAQEGVAQDSPVQAERELDPDDIIFQGKLYSSRKQQVSTTGAGKIQEIHVRVGDSVREDQPLVSIELLEPAYKKFLNDVSTEPLIDIETQLAEMDAQIIEARRNLQELQVLSDNDFAAPASVREQRTNLDLLQRKRESIQRDYDNVKSAIEDRVANLKKILSDKVDFDHVPRVVAVEAPFDGHVLRLNPDIHLGQTVQQDLSVAMIGVLDPMVIRAHLFELEASRIVPGEDCYFTLGTYLDRKFPAEVSYIALTPISPGLDQPSYYEVELSASNPDLLLREGFKVEVVIQK